MSNELLGLANTIQKLKKAVTEVLESDHIEFHSALNDEEPLKFFGLGVQTDRNEYMVEPSEVLFWHDPTAYIDEHERWSGQKSLDKHMEVKKFIETSEQQSSFQRLVESIKRKRISPFVGAGFAAPCKFPLWGKTLDRIVKKLEGVSASELNARQPKLAHLQEVKDLIANYEFLQAAQILYENHKVQFEKFIIDTFAITQDTKIIGPVKLLPRLTDSCIITTNFDGLIEKVFLGKNKPIEGYMYGTQTQNQFASKLIQGERCILKLHGQHDSPDTYIFSQGQYDNAYGKGELDYTKPLSKTLRQIFISKSLLFLGCSLSEDRTLELFIDVVSSKTFDVPEHFAVLPEPFEHHIKIEREDFLATSKITPIWYKVKKNKDGSNNHEQLEQLLEFAIDSADGKMKT